MKARVRHQLGRAAIAFAIGGFGVACGGDGETPPPPVPRVKVQEVGEQANQITRQLAGRLESVNRSSLAFGVSGTVERVLVKEGATVTKGQLLAALDADEFEARARSADSRLRAANADLRERTLNLRRQERLLAEELVAPAEVDRLRAELDSSRGQARAAESEKVQRDLDLRQSRIVAPMSGRVTRRNVEPFQEVMAGESLFEFAGEGGLQVIVQVPDTIVREVYYGQAAEIRIPSLLDETVAGRVSEIAASAGQGSAFRVAIDLEDRGLNLRPGMAATAQLAFEGGFEEQEAFLVPLSALALQEMAVDEGQLRESSVFVYDEASGTVRKQAIVARNSVRNEMAVSEGLAAGDRVVVAGVAFLHDGMPVRLWEPPE